MDRHFVCPQIQFIFKHDKASCKTLDIMTHKMLSIKVTFQALVVLEKLIVQALLFTDVALIVILMEMLMQESKIVEPLWCAEFANWMTREARSRPVSLFQVPL